VPLLVPYIILGAALLILFAGLRVERSLWTVMIAHTIVSLPYALLVIMARMVGFDKHLEEAAADLGSTYGYTLRRVILPLIAPAILAAWLVAFTVSFDEFILASFLIGSKPTLPVYLLSQLRFANRFPQVVAMTVVVMLASLSLVLFAQWLQRKGTVSTPAAPAGQVARVPGFEDNSFQMEGVGKSSEWLPAAIELIDVEALRGPGGGPGREPGDRPGRVLLAPGAFRLWKDHHPADDRRLRNPVRGDHPPGGGGDQQPAAPPPQREHGLPELRPLPAPERLREHRL
jgi:ABC-type molybdate transport system permease subunit